MYVLISILILIISFWLFKKAAGSLSLTRLNMISWVFYYNIILQSFFAAILVVNRWDNHYLINKLTNQDARFYGWLAVMYTSVALPIGMLLANFVFRKKTITVVNTYIHRPIVSLLSPKDSYVKIPLFIFSCISILAILYTLYSLPQIPILKVFRGGSAYELAVLRASASRDFGGNELFRNIFGLNLTPILTFVYYGYYKKSRRRFDLCMFVVMLFFTFLILTYNLEKSPLISFFLGFLFFKVLVDGSIPKKILYIGGGSLFAILIAMYIYIANQTDVFALISTYNKGILGRILLSQSAGTYLMFDIFPKIHDFIGFESISSYTSAMFGIEHSDRAARILMSYIKGGDLEAAGVVNSLFIGEAWSNFGWVGVLISPIFVGVVIQTLFLSLLSMKKTPLFLALLTFFSYKSSVTGGFNDYIYNMGYFMIFIIIMIIYLSGIVLKKL